MNANPSDELHLVGEFDEIVAGPGVEQPGLHHGLLPGREHDHRHGGGGGIPAEVTDHFQPVDAGHDEVLQDHRGPKCRGRADGLGPFAAELESHVGLVGKQPPHGFADHGLVIDEQNAVNRFHGARRQYSGIGA